MNKKRLTLGPIALAAMTLVGASFLTTTRAEASSQGAARSRSGQASSAPSPSHSAAGSSGRAVVTRSPRAGSHRVPGRHVSRGHRGHRGHPGRTVYGYRPGFGLSFGLGYWGGYYSPYFWGHGYYPYSRYWGPQPYPVRVYSQAVGAFDLNIKPKKTQVWVDGRYVGTAGKFDGFPDYLWLAAGEHQLVFYLDGYATVEQRVETLSGVVADLRIDMERGESTPPEEVAAEPAYEYRSTLPPTNSPTAEAEPRPRTPGLPLKEAPAAEPREPAGAELDARVEPARLHLQVEPGDASVYLDGRFLGTGEVLSRLHAGLLVDSGEHVLEVVRPGYADRSVTFSVAAGEEERLEIGLENPS